MSAVKFDSKNVRNEVKNPQHPSDLLLQLPDPVLLSVLQQLDPCSLACTAVTCSRLRNAVPACISQLSMRLSKDADEVSRLSFALWFSRNCNVLTSLTFLSMDVGLHGFKTTVQCLPCPQLQNLRLRGLPLQLQPSDGHAGVLHHCSGLTALTLDQCEIQDGEAAFAALAALPQLQHLVIEVPFNKEYLHLLPALQQMSSLTNLNLDYWSTYEAAGCEDLWQELSEQMEQQSPFSGLVNLQQLRWISPSQGTPFDGLPGGLPSQLVKLTNLDVNYDYVPTARSQLQQLSSMTALRDLNINIYNSYDTLPDFSVLEKLSQLTSLGIKCSNLSISAASTSAWASCLTALERLTLIQCDVQPAALAALTQLRALRLAFYEGFAEGHDLLVELSKLQLLTELQVQLEYIPDPRPAAPAEAELSVLPPAAAFLTSTNLCSLQLGLQNHWDTPLRNWVLFTPGALYPHLRCIDMAFEDESTYGLSWTGLVPLSEQQLQQLCSCCPAVRSLAFMAQQAPSPTAFLPLQQLSALTQLGIHSIPQLTDPALIPLTALTALKQLQLSTLDTSEPHGYHKPEDTLSLCNEARWCKPPDVWQQLLLHLLTDAACRQALLERSPAAMAAAEAAGAAAAPNLELMQLAAAYAAELAATSSVESPGSN